MQMDRREVVAAGAAAAAVAPFLATSPAAAERPLGTGIVPKTKTFLSSNFYAPEVTIFDHRGCNRAPKEYKGGKTGGQDDEMLVRVKSVKVFTLFFYACSYLIAASFMYSSASSVLFLCSVRGFSR